MDLVRVDAFIGHSHELESPPSQVLAFPRFDASLRL